MPPIKYKVRYKVFSNGDTIERHCWDFSHLLTVLNSIAENSDIDISTIEIE